MQLNPSKWSRIKAELFSCFVFMHVTLQIICQNKEDKKVQLKFSGRNLSQSYFALANSLDLQIHSHLPHCF